MARSAAGLGSGRRTTDFISLGVIAKTFPISKVHEVLATTGKSSVRQRELPAHVMVYYVIALALFMNASCREVLRCLLEGLHWLKDAPASIKATGKSGISQARSRLGDEPVRRLHDEIVRPIAAPSTRGAWFKHWRLVSLDGSTFDVADEPSLEAAFGRPGAGHGESAFPQIRFVSLVENGTHVLFGTKMEGCATSEIALTKKVLPALRPGMLCLADRNFFGFEMWRQAHATGADLLWRVKTNARLKCKKSLPDGSYLSHVYPSEGDRRRGTHGVAVRVINYRLEGVADAEPLYRLVTTILDPTMASAEELAALYHERWEIDIDQAWRLSRFCCRGGVSAFDGLRDSPPRRRGRSDRFQGCDRLGIRQDQLGALGGAACVAARQSALVDPGVEGRLRHPDFLGEFANRPFVRPALDARRTPTIFDAFCA
jgi:hypothetical protein